MPEIAEQVPVFMIFDAGLSGHPTYPYLRKGSGKVFDPSTDSQYGFLEIKFRKKGNIRARRC